MCHVAAALGRRDSWPGPCPWTPRHTWPLSRSMATASKQHQVATGKLVELQSAMPAEPVGDRGFPVCSSAEVEPAFLSPSVLAVGWLIV